ncbi:uncharacterized protein LOC108089698 [Drosophila ficusphila]|uniref:uncharacterized protein LOC108089698 n=1 Tax=Drosophila ficusphila TaxID=30025 RepID=UPI0007E71E53|nr:uncharacterized protein LOC108089698 [Drosophila ficusphila]
MFKVKFRDIGFFVLLTSLHICSDLQPVLEAHANIKSLYPTVDRNLTLQLGYNYNHWMLVKAVMYSLLVLIGLWYSRHLQFTEAQELEERKGILKNPPTAEEVKKNWLNRNNPNSETELGLFPWKNFILFALPWILTFVASGLINYLRFYMVIQHFCISNWRAIQLYGQLQLLFFHRLLSVALIPYWSQVFGGGVSLEKASNIPGNFISVETHLLDLA